MPTLDASFVGPRNNELGGTGMLPLTAMPNCMPMAVRAGTAVAFDNAIWHTTMPHTGCRDRHSLIVAFQSAGEGTPPINVSPDQLEEIAAAGTLTPALRSLLGADNAERGQQSQAQ